MQCPDCGYVMDALDNGCLRCTAQKDRSARNPYVAFQNEHLPPGALAPLEETASDGKMSADADNTEAPAVPASPTSARKPKIFLTAVWTTALLLLLYHAAVVSGMQGTIAAQQKQIDDQQKQINELRDVVNYNANAANGSRF